MAKIKQSIILHMYFLSFNINCREVDSLKNTMLAISITISYVRTELDG